MLHELEKLKIRLSPASVVAVNSASLDQHPRSDTRSSAKRQISLVEGDEQDSSTTEKLHVDIRVTSLGSRKQLCINDKLKSKAGDLDEACRQLLSGEHPSILLNFYYLRSHRERRSQMTTFASDRRRSPDARFQGSDSSDVIVIIETCRITKEIFRQHQRTSSHLW